MKILFSLMLFTSSLALANSVYEHQHDHKGHDRVGMHGMVMVTDGVELYASHLPLYRAPHDYQLIYQVETIHKAQLIKRLSETSKEQGYVDNMVTLLPAKFDLNQLIAGESFEIKTQLYSGNFERGGKKWLHDNNFKFVRQIYKRPLANLTPMPSRNTSKWEMLNTATEQGHMFVHNIQTSPSYDAIVFGNKCSLKESYMTTAHARVPTTEQLEARFVSCQSSQVLYFETSDFAQ